MQHQKSEFRNTTDGQIGVVVMEPGGKQRGIAVAPGNTIWLSEEEEVLTANAPRHEGDNPFANGSLQLLTRAAEVANRRPIGTRPGPEKPGDEQPAPKQKATDERRTARAQKQGEQGVRPVEETGAAVAPSGNPRMGKRAPAEEVATPEAPAKAS